MAPEPESKASKKTAIAIIIIVSILILASTAFVPACVGEAVVVEAGEVAAEAAEENAVLVEENAVNANADFVDRATTFIEEAAEELGPINSADAAASKAQLSLELAKNAIELFTITRESHAYETAFTELIKCSMSLDRLVELLGANILESVATAIARLRTQLAEKLILFRNVINGIESNSPVYVPTVGFRSAEESREIEMLPGTRFAASTSRGVYRPTENAHNLGLNNVGRSSGFRKRDLQDFIFGGTIGFDTLAIQTALKTIAENLNQSAINPDEFKSQVNDIISKINTEFQNMIVTNLNSNKTTLLDNYISPKLGKTDDYGRSIMGNLVKDYFTARIISTVMTSYGAVICSNDAGKVCSDNDCQCNTPIGDDSCTIAGGFGSNYDYKGYSNDDINSIKQWRNVSDICQNINGWNFPHVECSTSDKCGIDKNPFFRCPNAANDCDEYDFTMPFLFW